MTNIRLFTAGLPDETTATQFSKPRPADRSDESHTTVTFPVFKRGIDSTPEQATWWHDVKLVRLSRTNLSIQLGSGRPLVAQSIIDTNIRLNLPIRRETSQTGTTPGDEIYR